MQDLMLLTGSLYKTDEMSVASILSLKTYQQLKEFLPYLKYCDNPNVLQSYLYMLKKVKKDVT